MSREELEKKIIEYVAITYLKDPSELSMETEFAKDLAGGSILVVGLASLIENELNVLVPLPEVAACTNLKDLTDKVEQAL